MNSIFKTFRFTSAWEPCILREYGEWPYKSVKNIIPTDQISVDSSYYLTPLYLSSASISGDENIIFVIGLSDLIDKLQHEPKSKIYILFKLRFNKKQSGLRLRCIIPVECKNLTIISIWDKMSTHAFWSPSNSFLSI